MGIQKFNYCDCMHIYTHCVPIQDSSGREARVEQVFSLDGTTASLDLLPQMLLLPDLRALVRVHNNSLTHAAYM